MPKAGIGIRLDMQYFFETTESIGVGLGFSLFDTTHVCWLALLSVILMLNCMWYRKMTHHGRILWKNTVAVLLLAEEVCKTIILNVVKKYTFDYLPLHLCSQNIFFIAVHAKRPSNMLSNYLYAICIPGAVAALIFPGWTSLPVVNVMHIHSFTTHILLAMYPIVLTASGEIKPTYRMLPSTLAVPLVMAAIIYWVNLRLGTNFMFLMCAGKGNPLSWFEMNWGSHLWGFPVLTVTVLLIMYVPLEILRKYRKTHNKFSPA